MGGTNRINQGSTPVINTMALHEFLDLPAGAIICTPVNGGDKISVIRPPAETATFRLQDADSTPYNAGNVVMTRKLDAQGTPDEVRVISKSDFLAQFTVDSNPSLSNDALWDAVPLMRKASFENLAVKQRVTP